MAIVCGIDFSEPAGRAAFVAAKWAAAAREVLWLVHVREEQPATVLEREREEVERARAHLEAEAKTLVGTAEVRTELRTGLPDEELLRFAREKNARLIVVAALGRRSAERARLGSVAERLCRSGERAVLMIRDSRPFERWLKKENPLRILLALEGGQRTSAAVMWTSRIRVLGQADVTAARVYFPPEEWRRLGITGVVNLASTDAEIEQSIGREVTARVRRLEGEGNVDVRVIASLGRASEAIIGLAEQLGAELVVVSAHQRSFHGRLWFGSTSAQVLHPAPASVLRVPGHTEHATEVGDVNRVLVPIDFSPVSERALGRALSVLDTGGVVRLFHVLSPRAEVEQGESIDVRLRSLIPDEAAKRGLWVETEWVQHEDPARGICQAAERFDADFICMGTAGRNPVLRAVLGSVADAVVRQSPRPVILVKPERKG